MGWFRWRRSEEREAPVADERQEPAPSASEVVVAEPRPAVLELDPGTYWWCRCGRSQNQPFCDGSHKVTDLRPLKFEVEETRRVALCQCKHTLRAPFCDGSHKRL